MSECIEWGKARNRDGYGSVKFMRKMQLAHRVAYVQSKGLHIDDIIGMVVRHRCDNPGCVNPEHLEIGTHQDNIRDKVERGRASAPKGSKHRSAKLKESDIPQIRKMLADGVMQKDIAEMFGIDATQVCKIKAGVYWKHVPQDAA
jgi:HNH endonuclease